MTSDLLAVPRVPSFSRRIIGSKSYSKELILGFECRQMYMNARNVISGDRDTSQTSELTGEQGRNNARVI